MQQGSPPALAHGADDIFWMNKMHSALEQKGYSAGEEEVEMWLFGNQTLSALLTFQVRPPSPSRSGHFPVQLTLLL
jgi:hypothetical protein